jgi:hypothetical protein
VQRIAQSLGDFGQPQALAGGNIGERLLALHLEAASEFRP